MSGEDLLYRILFSDDESPTLSFLYNRRPEESPTKLKFIIPDFNTVW